MDRHPDLDTIADIQFSRILAVLSAVFSKPQKPEVFSVLSPPQPLTEEEDGLAWIGLIGAINERLNKT